VGCGPSAPAAPPPPCADTIAYLRAIAGRDDAVAVTLVSGDEAGLPLIREARIPF
jgi:hypothetical protein